MRKLLSKKSGFTLIELMIVVAILGILAAIAIPAFVTYVRRAKTVEATENVSKMFDAVSTYYSKEHIAQGIGASTQAHCTVDGTHNAVASDDQKHQGTYAGPWAAINFSVPPGYYRYEMVGTGACQNSPLANIYSLQAWGDLDDDGTSSLFEYAVASNGENELYHAAGIYINNETE